MAKVDGGAMQRNESDQSSAKVDLGPVIVRYSCAGCKLRDRAQPGHFIFATCSFKRGDQVQAFNWIEAEVFAIVCL